MIIDEVLECEDLNKQGEEVQDSEKAAEVINDMKILLKQKIKEL